MNRFVDKLERGIKKPNLFADWLIRKVFSGWLNDDDYLKSLFFVRSGMKLNLNCPSTFNEKLNWMKINYHNPMFTQMADKFEAKSIVATKIGSEYVVENYAVADSWDSIDFKALPKQFVIKCTHDNGGSFICRDKNHFDYDGVKAIIEHNLNVNYFFPLREWPYKNIKPRIIVDRFLDDLTGTELRDYKFWCFNGNPTYMYVTIKGENIFENFYDMNFCPVMINHGFPRKRPEFKRPANFELMKELATKLSNDVPFVRVDFFDVKGKVYFGEFTFYDWGGLRPFVEYKQDEELGKMIVLPDKML